MDMRSLNAWKNFLMGFMPGVVVTAISDLWWTAVILWAYPLLYMFMSYPLTGVDYEE